MKSLGTLEGRAGSGFIRERSTIVPRARQSRFVGCNGVATEALLGVSRTDLSPRGVRMSRPIPCPVVAAGIFAVTGAEDTVVAVPEARSWLEITS
eukprot:3404621-Rhodomonas_salina.5